MIHKMGTGMEIQDDILLLIIHYCSQSKISTKHFPEVYQLLGWNLTKVCQTLHFLLINNHHLRRHHIILLLCENMGIHLIMVFHWHLYLKGTSNWCLLMVVASIHNLLTFLRCQPHPPKETIRLMQTFQ